MIKHIVIFKLKDNIARDEKLNLMNRFKEAIEHLPTQIPIIRKIEVGLNINPAETWDIALYSWFDSMEDLNTYATHPLHVEAGKIIADAKESRACVDYQL